MSGYFNLLTKGVLLVLRGERGFLCLCNEVKIIIVERKREPRSMMGECCRQKTWKEFWKRKKRVFWVRG